MYMYMHLQSHIHIYMYIFIYVYVYLICLYQIIKVVCLIHICVLIFLKLDFIREGYKEQCEDY